jgi:serine/threonine-protein kinase
MTAGANANADPPPPPSGPSAADEVEERALEAERLAQRADERQRARAYAEAIELYERAYQASPSAVLSCNIAYLYDARLGAPRQAREHYARCVGAADVDDALAARAKQRLAALEAADARAEHPGAGAETPARGWHPLKIAGVSAAGVGVALLATTAVLALVAKSKDDEAATFCDGDRCVDPRALTLTEDASGLASAANVTFVSGAILVAGGVAMWLLAPKATRVSPRALTLGATF